VAELAAFLGTTPERLTAQQRRATVLMVISGGIALVVLFVAVLFPDVLSISRNPSSSGPGTPIEGAPGYASPGGGLYPVGRPWGRACQPIRLTVGEHVPDDFYLQVAGVVAEARRDGLNVTIEDRQFFWKPGALYYPPGTTIDDVRRVPVFSDNGKAPKLASGLTERVNIGWNTTRDSDGIHEDLIFVKGQFHLATMAGDPRTQRTTIRQLLAFTQGVGSTTIVKSGITRGTTTDYFSPADVAAMHLMSGCGPAAPIPPD
jgi:hypothetical protein